MQISERKHLGLLAVNLSFVRDQNQENENHAGEMRLEFGCHDGERYEE